MGPVSGPFGNSRLWYLQLAVEDDRILEDVKKKEIASQKRLYGLAYHKRPSDLYFGYGPLYKLLATQKALQLEKKKNNINEEVKGSVKKKCLVRNSFFILKKGNKLCRLEKKCVIFMDKIFYRYPL
ncbi:hypothetical protein ANTQUA_LOCUS10035 [Anthophora quadrimaculata]